MYLLFCGTLLLPPEFTVLSWNLIVSCLSLAAILCDVILLMSILPLSFFDEYNNWAKNEGGKGLGYIIFEKNTLPKYPTEVGFDVVVCSPLII